jgi:hypothetical protein
MIFLKNKKTPLSSAVSKKEEGKSQGVTLSETSVRLRLLLNLISCQSSVNQITFSYLFTNNK